MSSEVETSIHIADDNESDLIPLTPIHDQSVDSLSPEQSHNQSLDILSPNMISNNSTVHGFVDLTFSSKGLHLANINVRYLVPKIDEIRIILANEKGPDILGICETFLDAKISDGQVMISGYEFLRKDRCCTIDKNGGGVILYFRNMLNCKRRNEFEISNIETLWTEMVLPNSKPFLLCTLYRPPNAHAEWVDLFEEELSIAQATGLEIILMGDFNFDFLNCSNKKWLNLIQLFDLKQLITSPTRETQTSSSLIDHLYSSNPENITD